MKLSKTSTDYFSEPEPIEETPKSEPTPVLPNSQPPSPPIIELNPPASSHKKGGKKVKRLGRNQYTKDLDNMSPSRNTNVGASGSSGEDGKVPNGEVLVSKTSPNSGQDVPAPALKGKGRWKGKGSRAAAAAANDGDKNDQTEMTLKDMERATHFMLEFMSKNIPEQKIVEGTSMLRQQQQQQQQHTSSKQPRRQVTSEPDKPLDQQSSAEIADSLRRDIASFRNQFVMPNIGKLTVSS